MTDTNRVTKAAFARQMGVSPGRVTAWAKKGRLVMAEDDPTVVLAAESKAKVRDTTTRGYTNAANVEAEYLEDDDYLLNPYALLAPHEAPPVKAEADKLHDKVVESPVSLEQPTATLLLNNARALNEKVKVLQATAEHEKYMGSLVQLEKVERILYSRGRHFRDSLMSAARRLAPQIADTGDIVEVETMLTEEFRAILKNFAELPIIE